MADQSLGQYIQQLRDQHVSDDDIKTQLLSAGWSTQQVIEALVPKISNAALPPPPVPHFGMWVAFQYVILFICLYVSATALGGILHYAVDTLFPDSLVAAINSYSPSSTSNTFLLNAYISAILVTFPIFAVLFIRVKKELLEKPAIRSLRARKQLIYLTLIGTFVIMIGHLIMTIYGFLNGTITMRVLAHLGVTLFVAGSIFFYLLNEVRIDRANS